MTQTVYRGLDRVRHASPLRLPPATSQGFRNWTPPDAAGAAEINHASRGYGPQERSTGKYILPPDYFSDLLLFRAKKRLCTQVEVAFNLMFCRLQTVPSRTPGPSP